MKALLRVTASLGTAYNPYSLLKIPDGSTEDDLQVMAKRILPGLYADESKVEVDENGVCWNNGECWYIEDLHFISEEDAGHLQRILGLSEFS
ncbi:TPA: hypothetical protein ACHOZC_003498 [Raoultella ornithinolytica]